MLLQLRLRVKLAMLGAVGIGLHQAQQLRHFGVRLGVAGQLGKLLVE